jgi:hypothetical protein
MTAPFRADTPKQGHAISLVGSTVRLLNGPLAGAEGKVAWVEMAHRLAVDLGNGCFAIINVLDVDLVSFDANVSQLN